MTEQTQVVDPQNDLSQDKISSRRERYIRIDLRGLWKAYKYVTIDGPSNAFDWTTRNLDKASKPLMTGRPTVVTMPFVGIPVRNGARMAHDIKHGKHSRTQWLCGAAAVAASGGAWWVAGTAFAGWLGGFTAVASVIGKIGVTIAAAVATAPITVPAFVGATLVAATAVGIATSVVSVVPGLINIDRAWNRSYDAFKGVKYSEQTLKTIEEEINKDSIDSEYVIEGRDMVYTGLNRIKEEDRKAVYEKLKAEFDPAAAEVKVKAPKTVKDKGPDAPTPQ